MQKTGIEYLTHTWNPIAMRCTPVSPGCANCWHLRTADRLSKNPGLPEDERKALAGEGPFVLRERELDAPLRLKKPAVIGVQFMGDLFHEDVPSDFINLMFGTMIKARWHTFLILTKRPERMASFWHQYLCDCTEINHVYHGLTVCNQPEADEKIPELLKVPGKHFVSYEPALGPLNFSGRRIEWLAPFKDTDPMLNRTPRIDWVVCGGETGPGARPMHPDWVRGVRDQCVASGVPYFFKQWGEWCQPSWSKMRPSIHVRLSTARLWFVSAPNALAASLTGGNGTNWRGERMPDHPVINHIAWIGPDAKWHARGFLPLYNHVLRWAEGLKCPHTCQLAFHCHPMVWDEHHTGHKLCTLTVIRAGLIKRKELI